MSLLLEDARGSFYRELCVCVCKHFVSRHITTGHSWHYPSNEEGVSLCWYVLIQWRTLHCVPAYTCIPLTSFSQPIGDAETGFCWPSFLWAVSPGLSQASGSVCLCKHFLLNHAESVVFFLLDVFLCCVGKITQSGLLQLCAIEFSGPSKNRQMSVQRLCMGAYRCLALGIFILYTWHRLTGFGNTVLDL